MPGVSSSLRPTDFVSADPRADDGRRRIRLSPELVTIERRHAGVAMRLGVPAEAYAGVCLGLRVATMGRTYYELRLHHRDADLSVVLAEAFDDREIWADWRAWAAYFGLPTLIERADGIERWGDAPRLRTGPSVAAGPARRRVKRRRAAFVRRRQATPAGPRVVHRGAEIIARS